jgi:hypothetical protein
MLHRWVTRPLGDGAEMEFFMQIGADRCRSVMIESRSEAVRGTFVVRFTQIYSDLVRLTQIREAAGGK